jgi:hypothetical protein
MSKFCYDRRSVSRSVLVSSPHLGPKTRFLLLSDTCGFVDVGRPLWPEDGSVVYNCCWTSPAQSFSGPSPAGLVTIFYSQIRGFPQPGVPGPRIYIPQEQGGPVIPPRTWFPFRLLLRLAGSRWRSLTRLHTVTLVTSLLNNIENLSPYLTGNTPSP